MLGRLRASRIFAAGQSSEIGQYDVVHIAVIQQVVIELLLMAVRYPLLAVRYSLLILDALGGRCLSCPKALLLLQLLMALATMSLVNVVAVFIHFRRTPRDTDRVSGDKECLPSFEVMNCRLNLICFGEYT